MSKHLFDYNPIQEWNGNIINFGTSDDYNITEICTSSLGVSDAIYLVDAYSNYDVNTAIYINEIILKFFRGEIDESYISEGIEYETHLIESFLDVIMSFTLDSIYEIDITGILLASSTTEHYKICNKHIEEPRSMSLAVGTINNAAVPTEHGMPYMTLAWSDGALDPRCEDSAYTSQSACESSYSINPFCSNYWSEPLLSFPDINGEQFHILLTSARCGGDFTTYNAGRCYYTYNGSTIYSYAYFDYEECKNWGSTHDATSSTSGWKMFWWDPNAYTAWDLGHFNDWWPSVETQNTLTSHVVYEGEGIYFLPKLFEKASPTASSLTMNYDTFDLSGQSKIGRQTRVFYIGYEIDINTVMYQTQINPDNYLHATLPAHDEVDDNNSKVGNTYAYTSYYDRTRIRWRKPQYWTTNPTYPTPDRYRIYRSNSYYYGITSPTEYTMGIKRLVGEVPSTSVNDDLQYFEETEHSLRAEGMLPYQYCYYYITSVWDDWGTQNRGLNVDTWNNLYWNDDVDAFDSSYPNTTAQGELEINESGSDWSQDHSQKVYGYFKPQVGGTYTFKLTSDDAACLWIGDAGELYFTLDNSNTIANSLIDNSGLHPPTSITATIDLVEGNYYPLVLYYGNKTVWQGSYQNTLAFTPPGGVEQTAGVGYYFLMNDGSFNGNGQEVEGRFTTAQVRSYFR